MLTMAAIKPFSILRSGVLVTLVALASLTGPVFLPTAPARAAVIVLDPGHGGMDGGAGSGAKFAEKQFTLALARKISSLLSAGHQVELTRTSDIQLAPVDRAAVANHLRADLMISLHAAVVPYCSNRTATVYFHNDERLWMPSGASVQDTPSEADQDQPAWVGLQMRHQQQSRYLASTIQRSLGESGTFDNVTVSGVPLVTLMGTDLPAVLVEVGCIHPVAAPNPEVIERELNEYAQSIASAIATALPGLVR